MDFPRENLSYSSTHKAETSSAGWLILNVKNLDLEGVNQLYVNLDDIEAVKERKAKSESEADRLKKLLGG